MHIVAPYEDYSIFEHVNRVVHIRIHTLYKISRTACVLREKTTHKKIPERIASIHLYNRKKY
jgi:hypothetical protein